MNVNRLRTQLTFISVLTMPAFLNGCLTNDSVEPEESNLTDPTGNNSAPVIGGAPSQIIRVGVNYSFVPTASDPDSDPLAFSITNQPDWTTFDTSSGELAGMPLLGNEGTYNDIVIDVSDGQMTTALPTFSITVEPTTAGNMPPEISGTAPTSVLTGNNYSFVPSAMDPDGDPLAFSIVNIPGWATFNPISGELSGTPQPGDVGSYTNIAITVSDGQVTSSLPAFSITVSATNNSPQISGTAASSVAVGSQYDFTPAASDPDGDVLSFSIANRPSWASFDSSSGRLSGTPLAGDVGSYTSIAITVSDGQLTSSLPAFSISVNQVALGSATLSWTPPTQNTDGSALTNLASYRIYYGLSEGNYPNAIALDNPGLTSFVVENLTPGTYFFCVYRHEFARRGKRFLKRRAKNSQLIKYRLLGRGLGEPGSPLSRPMRNQRMRCSEVP